MACTAFFDQECVTYTRSLCIHIPSFLIAASRWSLFISCFCGARTMSRYASPADNTLIYQSIHSTPPRRPSAGVSRYDSLPLPTISRTQTESSTMSVGPTSLHGADGNTSTSFLWPWHKPAVDSDDREKMALVADERRGPRKVSMKPWEGWQVVLFGSCKSMALSAS
jgi:hypothetical protein